MKGGGDALLTADASASLHFNHSASLFNKIRPKTPATESPLDVQLAKLEQWSEITLPATFVTALAALKLMLVDVRDTLQSLSSLEIAVEVDTFGSIPANLVTYESDGDVVVTVSVSDGNESVLHPSDLQKAFRSALLLRTKRETGIKAWGKKDQATLEMTLQPTTASGITFVIDCHIRADTKPFWPISQANYLRHLGDRGETVLGVPWNRLVQAVIAYFKKHGICNRPSMTRPYLKTTPVAFLLYSALGDEDCKSQCAGCPCITSAFKIILHTLVHKISSKHQLDVFGDVFHNQSFWRPRDMSEFPHDVVVVRDCAVASPYYGQNMAYTLSKKTDESLAHAITQWCDRVHALAAAAGDPAVWNFPCTEAHMYE